MQEMGNVRVGPRVAQPVRFGVIHRETHEIPVALHQQYLMVGGTALDRGFQTNRALFVRGRLKPALGHHPPGPVPGFQSVNGSLVFWKEFKRAYVQLGSDGDGPIPKIALVTQPHASINGRAAGLQSEVAVGQIAEQRVADPVALP